MLLSKRCEWLKGLKEWKNHLTAEISERNHAAWLSENSPVNEAISPRGCSSFPSHIFWNRKSSLRQDRMVCSGTPVLRLISEQFSSETLVKKLAPGENFPWPCVKMFFLIVLKHNMFLISLTMGNLQWPYQTKWGPATGLHSSNNFSHLS